MKVEAFLIAKDNEKDINVVKEIKKTICINWHEVCLHWNFAIKPRQAFKVRSYSFSSSKSGLWELTVLDRNLAFKSNEIHPYHVRGHYCYVSCFYGDRY